MSIERLFVYGTLQPGGPNEHVLASIEGSWAAATVRGRLIEIGWGAYLGFPGLELDGSGAEVPGFVLTSEVLAPEWARLDAFEGDGYERVIASVTTNVGETVDAHVYVVVYPDR